MRDRHRYSWREVERENAANKMKEREKKEYLIGLMMNSNSTVWANYYSSALELQLNVEAGVSCFGKFFAIF
jgi:hypothetical protein